MFASTSALALAIAALFGSSAPAPHCATMGDSFVCAEESARATVGAHIWEENFDLHYVTTRDDGATPVVPDDMVVIQDDDHKGMYHVFTRTYAPLLHV